MECVVREGQQSDLSEEADSCGSRHEHIGNVLVLAQAQLEVLLQPLGGLLSSDKIVFMLAKFGHIECGFVVKVFEPKCRDKER